MNLIWALLVILIIAVLMIILSTRLLLAAISLALTSIIITILMFKLNSPLAAVFELSICAGLITVIFITTISFIKPEVGVEFINTRRKRFRRYFALPVIMVTVGFLTSFALKPVVLAMPQVMPQANVSDVLWNLRQVDIMGQAIILLIGVFGTVVLFREGKEK